MDDPVIKFILSHFEEIKDVFVNKTIAAGIIFLLGIFVWHIWHRRQINILRERVALYKDQLEGRTPDEIAELIKRLTSPRRITPQGRTAALAHIRRPQTGELLRVDLHWRVSGNNELLADDLHKLFDDAGWTVSEHRVTGRVFQPGIELRLREPEDAIHRNLRETIERTGLNVHVHHTRQMSCLVSSSALLKIPPHPSCAGTVQTLRACPPTMDAATPRPCVRISCSAPIAEACRSMRPVPNG
jgi:hypothetical protein